MLTPDSPLVPSAASSNPMVTHESYAASGMKGKIRGFELSPSTPPASCWKKVVVVWMKVENSSSPAIALTKSSSFSHKA